MHELGDKTLCLYLLILTAYSEIFSREGKESKIICIAAIHATCAKNIFHCLVTPTTLHHARIRFKEVEYVTTGHRDNNDKTQGRGQVFYPYRELSLLKASRVEARYSTAEPVPLPLLYLTALKKTTWYTTYFPKIYPRKRNTDFRTGLWFPHYTLCNKPDWGWEELIIFRLSAAVRLKTSHKTLGWITKWLFFLQDFIEHLIC